MGSSQSFPQMKTDASGFPRQRPPTGHSQSDKNFNKTLTENMARIKQHGGIKI
jgi:hypothetical protein